MATEAPEDTTYLVGHNEEVLQVEENLAEENQAGCIETTAIIQFLRFQAKK